MNKKIKTGSKAWLKSLTETVLAECPPLIECKKCGQVIREGFVCYCGCDDPGHNEVIPSEWI